MSKDFVSIIFFFFAEEKSISKDEPKMQYPLNETVKIGHIHPNSKFPTFHCTHYLSGSGIFGQSRRSSIQVDLEKALPSLQIEFPYISMYFDKWSLDLYGILARASSKSSAYNNNDGSMIIQGRWEIILINCLKTLVFSQNMYQCTLPLHTGAFTYYTLITIIRHSDMKSLHVNIIHTIHGANEKVGCSLNISVLTEINYKLVEI